MRFQAASLLATATLFSIIFIASAAVGDDLATDSFVNWESYNDLLQRVQQLESTNHLASYSDGESVTENYGAPVDDCCGCTGGYIVRVSNLVLAPFFTRDAAYNVIDAGSTDSIREEAFDWDVDYSPRFEFGFLNECGAGVRARYWYLDHDTSLTATEADDILIGFGDDAASIETFGTETITATHSLELDVIDLEVLYQRCAQTYVFGVRYVRMDQRYDATRAGTADHIIAVHSFEGIGPTMAVEGLIPLCCCCGVSMFAKARTSLLYGESDASAFDTADASDDIITRENNGDLIGIGEMQIGAEYRRLACCGEFFVTVALEAQYWINAGTSTPGTVEDDDASYHDESAQAADMGFLGATFDVGFVY